MVKDVTTSVAASNPLKLDLAQGRDELNLCEYPLVLPFTPKKSNELHSFETPPIWDAEAQQEVVRRVTISPSPQYGYPNPFDQRLIVALCTLGKQVNDFQSPKVPFSRYQLAKLLDLPDNGQTYKKLWNSLEKLTEITYLIEYAWWDHDAKTRRVKTKFNILDKVQWVEGSGRSNQLELPLNYFVFGSTLFDSLQSGYVKKIDLTVYNKLSSFIAQQTYRLLTKRFYRENTCEIDLRRFAHFHLALSPKYKTSLLKRKLESGIQELVDIGLIEPATNEERYVKTGRGQYKIVFRHAQGAPLELLDAEPPVENPVVDALVSRGITAAVAAMLVDNEAIPEERINAKIELLDWIKDEKPSEMPKNPGGWLRKAIEQDFQPPLEFKTKAEREADALRLADTQKRQRARKQQAEEQARKADEKQRREKQKLQQRIDAFLDALPDDERDEVIQTAIAKCGIGRKEARAYYEGNNDPLDEAYYSAAISNYVAPLLESRKATAS